MSDKKLAYAAFVAAQKEFAPALKCSTNPHFKSKYADLATVVEAVIDALNNHGLALVQRSILDTAGVTIQTVFLHESGEEIDGGAMHVPASKQDAQGFGSATTYCRRYGLMAACGIAPEDDDGQAASKPRPMPESQRLDFLAAIGSAEDMEGLKRVFTNACLTAHQCNDKAPIAEFTQAKDKRKAQLEQK